jgi:hypothetical protein
VTTPDLERQLAVVLQRHAEDAMNRTDTSAKLEDLLDGAQEDLRRRRRRTGATGLGAAAASIALIAAVLIFAVNRDDAGEPASPPDSVTPAEGIAYEFLEAYGVDRQRASSYFANEALADRVLGSPADGRWLEATGFRTVNAECDQVTITDAGALVVCTYDFHGLGSDQLGEGPFGDNTFISTVRLGRVVEAVGRIVEAERDEAHLTNGFSSAMWAPFNAWVSLAYPYDANVMYTDASHTQARLTNRSIALWERHVEEYVAENE